MEEVKAEQEADEFDILLNLIPNAISGSWHSENAILKDSSSTDVEQNHFHDETRDFFTAFSLGKLGNTSGRTWVEKSETSSVRLDGEQSLSSSFAELSFNGEEEAIRASSSQRLDHLSLLGDPFANLLNESIPFSPRSRRLRTSSNTQDIPQFSVGRTGKHNANFLMLDDQVQRTESVSCQTLGYQTNPPQVLLTGTEVPNLRCCSQSYFPSLQSPAFGTHSQEFPESSHTPWLQHAEEERYSSTSKKYLHLQNQQLEAQNLIQASENAANVKKSYVNSPSSSCQYNPQLALSPRDPNPSYPQNILVRKNGRNWVKEIKESGSLTNSRDSNGNFYDNGHRNYSPQPLDTKDDRRNDRVMLLTRKHNPVDEVSGRIYSMAKDQCGCRFLQRKLSEGNVEDIEKIFLEIVGHVVELMTHPFGNYLVQKLLEVCSEDQRTRIVIAATAKAGDLIKMSINIHGTRSVQKVIETIKSPEQILMVVSSLKPGILSLIKDTNGYHVAECCFQCLTPRYIELLFGAVSSQCVELATDCHGCRLLQKCIKHSYGEHRRRLLSAIIVNALILSQDSFGNYAVQYVFELEDSWAKAKVLGQLKGYYRNLSMQKYSSNVVEKCLEFAGEEQLAHIIQEFMDHPRLDQMMLDPFANYVIQTALNRSKGGAHHAALLEAIRPHLPALRATPQGKKILSCSGLKKKK